MASEDPAISKKLKDWIKTTNEILLNDNNLDVADAEQKELLSLSTSLFELFKKGLSPQLMGEVCQQLITLFRSKKRNLHLLVLEFIPLLIWSYLSTTQSSSTKVLAGLEACLLTLYNLNLQSEDGVQHITIPSLVNSSVYHEFGNITTQSLTESVLSKYDSGERKLPVGPFPQVEKLNAKNRLSVMSHLIRCYTKDIGLLSGHSHQSLCDLSIKVCCTGFKTYLAHSLLPRSSQPADTNLISSPRITTSPEFLCELLHGIYFVMFNSQPERGLQVLECIHQRANYELYSSVILITNAIRNSLEHNPSGQPYDGPMGVSIAITPAHKLSSLNQTAITNASFKTQKLPDDITPEIDDGSTSDPDTDGKAISTVSDKQNKLLSGIKLSTRPLKSALKRVERSITQKKTSEAREVNHSVAKSEKIDKPDGSKTNHTVSSPYREGYELTAAGAIGLEKLKDTDIHENDTNSEGSFSTANPGEIEIVVVPPEEDVQSNTTL